MRPIDRRGFLYGSLGATALAALAACGSSDTKATASATPVKAAKDGSTLNLFAWEGYFAPEAISGFQKKYGITVKQTAVASSSDQLQKVVSKQPFDVVIANSTFLPQVSAAKLLRTIEHGELSNWGEVISYFNNPYFDPGAKYSVGYAMAPLGIAYRSDKFSGLSGSWTDLWTHASDDPKHVYVLNDFQLTLSTALMHLGLDANSSSKDDLDKAVAALQELKPKLGGFGSTNTIQALSSGQSTMIPSYTGNVYTAIQQKGVKHLSFELCKEGQLFNDDVMSVPVAAKNPGNAMLFINWMLAPENMAANVKYIGYPVPTTTGLKTYNELVKDTPFLEVGTNLLNNTGAWQKGLTGTQRALWNQAWLKVQA